MFASMHQLQIRVVDGFKIRPCVLQETVKQFYAVTRSTVLLTNWPRAFFPRT